MSGIRSALWSATKILLLVSAVGLCPTMVGAHDEPETPADIARDSAAAGTATYLGNEGVLVHQAGKTIVFDPLFDNTFGRYEQVPNTLRQNLLLGQPPFEQVDVVLVSHYHGDHFSPELMVQYLTQQATVLLVAPIQAVAALRNEAAFTQTLNKRIYALEISPSGPPQSLSVGGVQVDATRIPHSGWPQRMTDVQNMAYRVTFSDATTVLHMGDADTSDEHFAVNAAHWSATPIQMAFPPYWYFSSLKGRQVLEQRLRPVMSVGVHVPKEFADDPQRHPAEFSGYDLFTVPGDTRTLPSPDNQ